MIEKISCEACVFYKVFDLRKNLLNFNYRTNLSEMKLTFGREEMNLTGQFFPIGSPGSDPLPLPATCGEQPKILCRRCKSKPSPIDPNITDISIYRRTAHEICSNCGQSSRPTAGMLP